MKSVDLESDSVTMVAISLLNRGLDLRGEEARVIPKIMDLVE